MVTAFTVGMEVYDSVTAPGQKGKVIEIKKSSTYPIVVEFDEEDEDIDPIQTYTYDGRINEHFAKTLSLCEYGFKNFKQPKL